jgi:sensory rhodopsin
MTLLFAVLGSRKETAIFNTELFVSFITAISYIIMASGVLTITASNGQLVYWSRWLFYIVSCGLLATDIALHKGLPSKKVIEIGLYTGLTMFAGFLASVFLTVEKWWFFALSSIAFIALLVELRRGENTPVMSRILAFVAITWTLFPVVFVLAPTGFGIIDTLTEVVLYGLLDLITKIIFGLYMTTKVKQ